MDKEGALPDLGRLVPEPSLPGEGVRQPEGRAPVGQSQAPEGILEKGSYFWMFLLLLFVGGREGGIPRRGTCSHDCPLPNFWKESEYIK